MMMTKAIHDPFIKSEIWVGIHDFLFTPSYTKNKNTLNNIIVKNCLIVLSSELSFIYKGDFYFKEVSRKPRVPNRLSKELYIEMQNYLVDHKVLVEEIPVVSSFIFEVLNSSNSFDDYLNVLPECIHSSIKKVIHGRPTTKGTLSNTQVLYLQKKYEKEVAVLKTRLVLNLIQS